MAGVATTVEDIYQVVQVGRVVPVPEIPARGQIYLRPSMELVVSRPKVLPGSYLRLFPIRTFSGKVVSNHTRDELEQVKEYVGVDFWRRYVLTIPHTGKVYDVTNMRDMVEFRLLFLYPVVSRSKDKAQQQHLFYVENLYAEAQDYNRRSQARYRAMKALYEMTSSQKIDFLALYEPVGFAIVPEVAEMKLAMEIDKDPYRFISYLENEETTRNAIDFNMALHMGVIKVTPEGEYLYNRQVLGYSKEEALQFFSHIKNQKIKMSIKEETEKKRLL